jgi:chemotaxis protein CheZ
MADHPLKRRFTAEIKKNRQIHAFDFELPSDSRNCVSTTGPKQAGSPDPERERQVALTELPDGISLSTSPKEITTLYEELRQLKHAIDQMRLQIAALRHESAPPAPWEKATGELDAVVQATEDATQNILEAAETIDALLQQLPGTGVAAEPVEKIADQIIRIFEACNFQDITGQRINKVVSAMKFIETKVERMIEILGGQDALKGIEPVVEEHHDADAKLLEGPQLDPDNQISQNDIDRFFD